MRRGGLVPLYGSGSLARPGPTLCTLLGMSELTPSPHLVFVAIAVDDTFYVYCETCRKSVTKHTDSLKRVKKWARRHSEAHPEA